MLEFRAFLPSQRKGWTVTGSSVTLFQLREGFERTYSESLTWASEVAGARDLAR